MKIKNLAGIMHQLFEGREGTYAIRMERSDGSKLYVPARDKEGKNLSFTPQVCQKHLEGQIAIGIYPIDSKDEVRWISVDFDGKIGNALEDAVNLKSKLLTTLGIISFLERSQGGSGVHLWIFLDSPIKAWMARYVIGPLIEDFSKGVKEKTTSFDRILPNQDSVVGGYGNLCALPLNGPELVAQGRTAFIDDKGVPFKEQSTKLMEAFENRNKSELFLVKCKGLDGPPQKAIKTTPIANAKGGIKLLSPYGCNWLKDAFARAASLTEPEWHAALSQFAQLEDGESIAHKFSEPYPEYNFDETRKKYEYAVKANKPHSIETIHTSFGECPGGCRCKQLGLKAPWELANVPITKLLDVSTSKLYTAKDLAEISIKLARELDSGKRMGLPWGYDLVDDATELRAGDLIVVAARRSMGKSAVMVDAAVLGARKGIPQYLVSLEMTAEQLGLRLLARLSEIDNTLITTGRVEEEKWDRLENAAKELSSLPIFIDDHINDIDRMLDILGELVYTHGKGIVWVDFLQLVKKRGNENKKEAVERAVMGYKSLAKIIEIPVITLAQLNRQEETYEGDDELDAWLKDTGLIEEISDVIFYIRGKRLPGIVSRKWILHKERHRASGMGFKFEFDQSIYKFTPQRHWATTDDKEFDLIGEEDAYDTFEEN